MYQRRLCLQNGADEDGTFSDGKKEVEMSASSSDEEAEEYHRSEAIVEKLSGMSWLKYMRCAVHTLQLAVTDFLKTKLTIVAKASEV